MEDQPSKEHLSRDRRIFEAKMEEVELPMMKLAVMPDGAI